MKEFDIASITSDLLLKNGRTAPDSDFIVSRVESNPDTTGALTENTLVRLTAKPESRFTGTKVVTYRRVQLSELTNIFSVLKVSINYRGVADLVKSIEEQIGIVLDAGSAYPFEMIGSIADPNGTVTLKVHPNHPWLTGEATISYKHYISLSGLITVTELGPWDNTPNRGADTYMDSWDISHQIQTLSSITAETYDPAAMATYLRTVTGHPWTNDGTSKYSLLNSTFVSNDGVLIIQLDLAVATHFNTANLHLTYGATGFKWYI